MPSDRIELLLLTLGSLLLLALATDLLGRRTPLPRVTLLLVLGFLVGPNALALLPDEATAYFPVVAEMALVMIGFLIGGSITRETIREHGRLVLWVSVSAVALTAAVVGLGTLLVGASPVLALALGAIATSTAPAATMDVVRETGADGPFTRSLLGIVAIDDAWGLLVFAFAMGFAGVISGDAKVLESLGEGARDTGGALLLGAVIGVPMAFLTGRIRPGEPSLIEALGLVLLCGGLALHWHVSSILAAMTMGAIVANLARHHSRPFRAVEGIEWPFMAIFFGLAGASLDLRHMLEGGALGLAYVALRVVGRIAGAWCGARVVGAPATIRRWMGVALLPQAGVAVGVALIASQRLPDIADRVLPVVIGATVVFEVVGPICTRLALQAVGEARGASPRAP
ncbi:MAG: cation:proton antiporter [Planctomycetota bacterium]|jgi:Kef-type K+ transport system membrane component KefB